MMCGNCPNHNDPCNPDTITIERPKEDIRKMPLYKTLLHNDDHNSMEHVVAALQHVFKFEIEKCITIMIEAHQTGVALCKVSPKEHAELYQDQLKSLSLTATIEED